MNRQEFLAACDKIRAHTEAVAVSMGINNADDWRDYMHAPEMEQSVLEQIRLGLECGAYLEDAEGYQAIADSLLFMQIGISYTATMGRAVAHFEELKAKVKADEVIARLVLNSKQ